MIPIIQSPVRSCDLGSSEGRENFMVLVGTTPQSEMLLMSDSSSIPVKPLTGASS